MKRILFLFGVLVLLFIPTKAFATNEVNIYLFHSDTCNLCKQEITYLEALKERYPNIRVYKYEVSDSNNYKLMVEAKKMFNITTEGVPFTVVGDNAHIGFSQDKKALIQRDVYKYSVNKYNNELGKKLNIGYLNNLDIVVKEYKENDSYVVEESSGIVRPPIKTESIEDKKYRASIYLITVGVVLGIIALILAITDQNKEKKARNNF